MKYFLYLRKSTDDKEHQILSLESQERETLRRVGNDPEIEIVERITENQSAKSPGRPLFNAMLKRIVAGAPDGVTARLPARLARNPIDGGQIVHPLDTRALEDLTLPSYLF